MTLLSQVYHVNHPPWFHRVKRYKPRVENKHLDILGTEARETCSVTTCFCSRLSFVIYNPLICLHAWAHPSCQIYEWNEWTKLHLVYEHLSDFVLKDLVDCLGIFYRVCRKGGMLKWAKTYLCMFQSSFYRDARVHAQTIVLMFKISFIAKRIVWRDSISFCQRAMVFWSVYLCMCLREWNEPLCLSAQQWVNDYNLRMSIVLWILRGNLR